MAATDDIADALTLRDLQLNRLAESERRKVFTMLNDVQRNLLQKLSTVDPAEPARITFKQKRLVKLMKEVNEILRDGYSGIAKEQKAMLKELSVLEAAKSLAIVNIAVGFDLMRTIPTHNELKALVDDIVIEGAPVQEWWSRQAQITRDQFRDQMRQGLFIGESNSDLMRRVRGTRENRFQDGIMGITRRNAERIVRTSVNSVSNAAREATFKDNADILRGVQALARLDSRTSDICKARSGGAWNPNTGRPLKESRVRSRYPGPPPWHWRCRTTLIYVIIDEKAADDLGFEGWLSKQTKATQEDALGPGRLDLWKKGKISMTDLIDQRGRPLTLEQLKDVA